MSSREQNSRFIEKAWDTKLNRVFEQVFEHSLIGMAILDSKGNFLRLNKKACEIWEYSEHELIGKTWKDITHPDDMEVSLNFTDSYKDKSQTYNIVLEKRYITGCGNIKTCKITATAMHNDNGDISFFIVQVQDITQKKEAICSLQKGLDFIKSLKDKGF